MSRALSSMECRVARLIEQDGINYKTVERLMLRTDGGKALERYVTYCEKKHDDKLLKATHEQEREMLIEICLTIIETEMDKHGARKESVRKRIAEQKAFFEQFGMAQAMRAAWKQYFATHNQQL